MCTQGHPHPQHGYPHDVNKCTHMYLKSKKQIAKTSRRGARLYRLLFSSCDKAPRPRQLTEGKVYLGLTVHCLAGGALHRQTPLTEPQAESSYLKPQAGSTKSDLEMVLWLLKPPKSAPSDTVPPSRPCLINLCQLCQLQTKDSNAPDSEKQLPSTPHRPSQERVEVPAASCQHL